MQESGNQHLSISFSRFGRNLEKTQFQSLKNSGIGTPERNVHGFTIYPQQPLKEQTMTRVSPTKQITKDAQMQEQANFIFKRVGRNKGIFFRGAPGPDKPIEPRYNPKYDMLYPHPRECYIKPTEPSVERPRKDPSDLQPTCQTVPVRATHIQLPTPMHLQLSRQPLINKSFCQKFEFLPPSSSQSNRSHSFASYLPHQLLLEKHIMPEYEVSTSWDRTQSRKPRSINFGKQKGLIITRLDKDKSLNTPLLDYDGQISFNHQSHVKRIKQINFSVGSGRESRTAQAPRSLHAKPQQFTGPVVEWCAETTTRDRSLVQSNMSFY